MQRVVLGVPLIVPDPTAVVAVVAVGGAAEGGGGGGGAAAVVGRRRRRRGARREDRIDEIDLHIERVDAIVLAAGATMFGPRERDRVSAGRKHHVVAACGLRWWSVNLAPSSLSP